MSPRLTICLLGFGEVGQILASDLELSGIHELCAWDVQFALADSVPSRALASRRVRRSQSAHDAVKGADLVISAVTAAQDLAAAQSVVSHLERGAWFLDVNSVSPTKKQAVAQLIHANGGRYVEAAIMSPIAPRRIDSPMLFGGPHAAAFLPLAHGLGFKGAELFSDQVGRASAAKMCRSVMVKGMEALVAESLLTARRYGVEQTVMDSLANLLGGEDWAGMARYMISRSLRHGARRAEEMREVAQTVREAGIAPWMTSASAERHEWASQFASAVEGETLTDLLDRLLRQLPQGRSAC